ncbi:hypothetical protein RSOLAG1IB_04401 [Rhizoctonia solani AG-1 IB]|uniref:C2H2-type domain-containing protein n=1 Tax=Thanatephorus cucumeris (strain AG1-IB / isolate 7/3/14) TaxID=1108050 RepID=A0A0B7FUN4_THACB|nr:hypothetical protein RSOLAG1IB_04401 [Rhizoctonia solani AG-1 IB]
MDSLVNQWTSLVSQLAIIILSSWIVYSLFRLCVTPKTKEGQASQLGIGSVEYKYDTYYDSDSQTHISKSNLTILCNAGKSHKKSPALSPVLETPASKGYSIGSEFVEELLGRSYYFIAVVESEDPVELGQAYSPCAIFVLSPDTRAVSMVDENSCVHFHHVDRSSGPIIHFKIGQIAYQWDIQHSTVSCVQSATESSTSTPSIFYIHLYTDIKEAESIVQGLQSNDFDFDFDFEVEDSDPESPNPTDSVGDSPAPLPDESLPALITGSPKWLFGAGVFGPSPSQQDIDVWVNANQADRDENKIKCPVAGCNHSSRRPHALKTHLYAHYRIKPFSCELCGIKVLTEANLARHKKNVCTPRHQTEGVSALTDFHGHSSTQSAMVAAERTKKSRHRTSPYARHNISSHLRF